MGKKVEKRRKKGRWLAAKGGAYFFVIVEMVFNAFDFLIGFVSFTGDKDDIAGTCHGRSGANGFAAVGDVEGFGALLVVESGQHVLNDVFGAFKSRIVGGDDHLVGLSRRFLRHEGTLPLVAVAAGAANGDDTAVLPMTS